MVAYVVPQDKSVSVQELDRFCKQHPKLSNLKRPRKYVFVEEIPKSPAGKILRRELRSLLMAQSDG